MLDHFLAPAAYADMESILARSKEQFGEQAQVRYEKLLACAILDVADDPDRVGSYTRSEIVPSARTYHLLHSRDHVGPVSDRVRQPCHYLLFRVCADGSIEIGRVLHENMDLARQLPKEYRP